MSWTAHPPTLSICPKMTNTTLSGTGFRVRSDVFSGRPIQPAESEQTVDPYDFLVGPYSKDWYSPVYKSELVQRLENYRRYLSYYNGEVGPKQNPDGTIRVNFNFIPPIINKGVDFLSNMSFDVRHRQSEDDGAKLLDGLWELSGKDDLLKHIADQCSIFGDAYIYVQLQGIVGTDGKERFMPRLCVVDPFYIYPVLDPLDPSVVTQCVMRYPIGRKGDGTMIFRTVYISDESFTTVEGDGTAETKPNPFKAVNVVHVVNVPDPVSAFGRSDIKALCALNDAHNEIRNSLHRIVRYHGEPTTIVFGAKASRLEKGSNKVWSGLPADGRVENLEMKGDLSAMRQIAADIRSQIFLEAETPEVLFDPDRAVSHATGVALKMLYQPLLSKTARKAKAFQPAFRRASSLMLAYLKSAGESVPEMDITQLEAVFPDPLPYDESAILDRDLKRLAARLVSREALLRQYFGPTEWQRVNEEIEKDKTMLPKPPPAARNLNEAAKLPSA